MNYYPGQKHLRLALAFLTQLYPYKLYTALTTNLIQGCEVWGRKPIFDQIWSVSDVDYWPKKITQD